MNIKNTNSKQIFFFMTKADIEPILSAIENKKTIKYVRMGLFNEKENKEFHSYKELPDLGISIFGNQNLDPLYLIVDKNTPIKVREIPQIQGGIKYSFDQLENIRSVVLNLGGVFKDNAIIAGRIGTVHSDSVSRELYDLFKNAIIKNSKKIRSYHVGLEAYNNLKSGWRMTPDIKSPLEYDLVESLGGVSINI